MEKRMFPQSGMESLSCLETERTVWASLPTAQRDPSKFCGPLVPHIQGHIFLTLSYSRFYNQLMLGLAV